MSDRDEFGAFMIGFVVGALTGAVASLLFAPQSGEETRVLIKERAIELGDRVNETATKVGGDVESPFSRVLARRPKNWQPKPAPMLRN